MIAPETYLIVDEVIPNGRQFLWDLLIRGVQILGIQYDGVNIIVSIETSDYRATEVIESRLVRIELLKKLKLACDKGLNESIYLVGSGYAQKGIHPKLSVYNTLTKVLNELITQRQKE